MAHIDDHLPNWSELANEENWDTVVIGNGASINIWPDFCYDSLFDAAAFDQDAHAAFDAFETCNFETVLSGLAQTRMLLSALDRDHEWVDVTYRQVRDGLFGAVRKVHVPWNAIPPDTFASIASYVRSARRVFTMNYDLILYWARLHRSASVPTVDFFWGTPPCFDVTNTEVWGGRTAIYQLHGGLHLWHDSQSGQTGKLVREQGSLLDVLQGYYEVASTRQPLFVSEGLAPDKLRAIRKSDYLTFAYRTLFDDHSPTVVFGSSLSASDNHVVEAIKAGPRKKIAVSLLRGSLSSDQVMECKARISAQFGKHATSFFDATTHPLGAPRLRAAAPQV